MGKYIKGKKLPKGISQRKDDGKFMAGFVYKGEFPVLTERRPPCRRSARRCKAKEECLKLLRPMRSQTGRRGAPEVSRRIR